MSNFLNYEIRKTLTFVVRCCVYWGLTRYFEVNLNFFTILLDFLVFYTILRPSIKTSVDAFIDILTSSHHHRNGRHSS